MASQYCVLRICLLSEYTPVLSSALPQTPNQAGAGGFFQRRGLVTIPCKHRGGGTEGFCITTFYLEKFSTPPWLLSSPRRLTDHRQWAEMSPYLVSNLPARITKSVRGKHDFHMPGWKGSWSSRIIPNLSCFLSLWNRWKRIRAQTTLFVGINHSRHLLLAIS